MIDNPDSVTKNRVKIAILGWGSLLWDSKPEFDSQHLDWEFDGPALNLEFSRKSGSRKNALTLVIDPVHGAPCTVAWSLTKRNSLREAVEDLRKREGTSLAWIKSLSVVPELSDATETEHSIKNWAKEKGIDHVVWTALESNFESFSVQKAESHLHSLNAEGKCEAIKYIRNAPVFIDTPVRRKVQASEWFIYS